MTVAEFVTAFQREGGQMTIQTYYKLAKTGVVPKPDKGVIDAKLAAVKIALYYREMTERQAGDVTLTSQRIRLTRAITARKELELKREMGEVIDTGQAMFLWSGIMENMRVRLAALPDTLAPLLMGCGSATEAESITRGIIHRVLTELSAPSLKAVVAAAELKPKKEDIHYE
ncbi:hypothetical protein NBG4_1070001 [Candidatus Sulfobium mesophilum]|uniref:Terminase small subunit n=1 Tax=Candidatus Sulfobium mesophilum TaxID=2016548 RepID=A0A2U3QE23_9BACT|nr:hypothetical protein NBG4_1070001 [Candidatus Sulfobium mesophilum]